MTRKRFINLVRAISVEAAKDSNRPNRYKGWESGWRKLAEGRKNGKRDLLSYEEMFEMIKPLAHRYGIGGY